MSRNVLINIRGAGGSGKTTAVKQYCELHNFKTEQVNSCSEKFIISVLENNVIVMGDYGKRRTCLGADTYKGGMKDIMDCFVEVVNEYHPNAILYEHRLSSLSGRSTLELIKLAKAYDYSYFGLFLEISEENRKRNMYKRSGKIGKKFYAENASYRIANNLKKSGVNIEILNIDEYKKEDMWRIVDDAVRKAME